MFLSIFALFNSIKMNKIVLLTGILFLVIANVDAQKIKEIDNIFFENGQPYTGSYTSCYDNGNIKMEMKVKEGKKHGQVRIFFENGQLNEIRSYKNNLMHGKWELFNRDNIKVSVARYKKGEKNGKWLIWNDKGTLLYQLYYKDGKKCGIWKRYDNEGNLVSHRKY
jgi:antitoxin component YwqK of YwqJK toxin-antitoxin module